MVGAYSHARISYGGINIELCETDSSNSLPYVPVLSKKRKIHDSTVGTQKLELLKTREICSSYRHSGFL